MTKLFISKRSTTLVNIFYPYFSIPILLYLIYNLLRYLSFWIPIFLSMPVLHLIISIPMFLFISIFYNSYNFIHVYHCHNLQRYLYFLIPILNGYCRNLSISIILMTIIFNTYFSTQINFFDPYQSI